MRLPDTIRPLDILDSSLYKSNTYNNKAVLSYEIQAQSMMSSSYVLHAVPGTPIERYAPSKTGNPQPSSDLCSWLRIKCPFPYPEFHARFTSREVEEGREGVDTADAPKWLTKGVL
jgi:hypothetical protein